MLRRTAPSSSPAATSVSMRSSWAAELIAPTSVFLSSGSPTRSRPIRRHSLSTTSSRTLSWISSREPAQHTWPWLKKIPLTIPSTAWSRAASSKTMLADLPPSSSVSPTRRPASAAWISRPTAVEPVKAILSTPGARTSAAPAFPSPGRIATTPGGSSASWQISAKSSAVSGVVGAGLRIAVLPQASAGASFQAAISSGKFQGTICPTTPRGATSRACTPWRSLSAQLAGALLDQPRDPEQKLAPLKPGQRRPGRLRRPRPLDGERDVGGSRPAHLGDRLLAGRVDRGQVAALDRVAELAVEEQAVAVAETQVVDRLRGGSVIPHQAGARPGAHSREKSSGRP